MLKEFKQFLLRGNVIDLAVGVIIGAAFTSIVNALVSDLLNPLIGAIAKIPDFSGFSVSLNGSEFLLGHLFNTIISFLMVATAVFFFVVKPTNILISKSRKEKKPADPTTKKCPQCLSEISIDAKRCAFCTSRLS